tara:strand:- start:43 stop:150 length:108 start_codon:yes stop_codon:yes gene_type:complete
LYFPQKEDEDEDDNINEDGHPAGEEGYFKATLKES